MEFVDVARVGEIPPGQMKGYDIGAKTILIASYDGNYYAIGGKCTHRQGDLAKGTLEGNVVVCPRHKSRFDVTTGNRIAGPAKENEPAYELKIVGDSIRVKI